jgi:hypothetical protein
VFQSVRRPGSPLTERAVNFIVKAAADRAGVNPAASIHWLRHAHASHAIDNGAPITLVSATLRHADLMTTSVYARAARREQRPLSEDEVLVITRQNTTLQTVGGMLGYLRVHRGQRFAATTAVAPMTEAFVADIEHTLIVLELPQVHLRDVVLALALLKGNEIRPSPATNCSICRAPEEGRTTNP